MTCLTMFCWSVSSKMAKEFGQALVVDTQCLDVAAQDTYTKRMECGDQRLGKGTVSQQALDALCHFAGGLVGKGNGED